MSAEQIDQLQDKAKKELVMVRQRLDEALSQERRAMRCGLIKKRRELISELVRSVFGVLFQCTWTHTTKHVAYFIPLLIYHYC